MPKNIRRRRAFGNFEDVGENGAYPKTSMQEGYAKVVEPTTWKSSFEVTQEMVEDAKYGKIKSRANIFATSFNRTREEFAAGLLAGGTGEKNRHRRARIFHRLGGRRGAVFRLAPVHHGRHGRPVQRLQGGFFHLCAG